MFTLVDFTVKEAFSDTTPAVIAKSLRCMEGKWRKGMHLRDIWGTRKGIALDFRSD